MIDRVLQAWRKRPSVNNAGGEASRRLHLHFYAKPLEVVTDDDGRVAAFRWERTRPDGEGGVVGTGEIREVPIQAIYRAVGYFGSPLAGRPVRQAPRRDPEPRGSGAAQGLQRPCARRLRDRLDQARTGRPDRPHQVRRDGDHPARHQRPGDVVAARRSLRGRDPGAARGARRALDRPRRLAPPRRARSRLGAPHGRARIKVVPRDEMVDVSRAE